MKYPLYILGFLWSLPAILIVWLFYVIPLIIFRQIKFIEFVDFLTPGFQLINNDSWYAKKWKDWYGWSGPCVIIFKNLETERDDKWVTTTKVHEVRHCQQQLLLGIFFYPFYLLHSVYIWCFNMSKHAYLDNVFERDARKYAGQLVDVPKERWMHGPSDRWPWW